MSNDPDLLDEECRDCWGRGWEADYCSYELCGDPECEWFGRCPACNGEGRVLRGLR